MKNISKVVAFAAMAAALVSCQKSGVTENANQKNKGGVRIVVRASEAWSPDDAEATKTHLDAGYNVIWDADETMTLFCAPSASDVPVSAVSESAEVSADGKTADFSFTLSGTDGWANFIYGGVYPSEAVDGGGASDALSSIKVVLPSSQTPTATAYDPASYIMVAKPQVFSEVRTSIGQWFRRAVALNKFTLSGFSLASDEKVSSVTFTLPEGKVLAGGRRINLATGESGEYDGGVSVVTLNYAEPFTVSGGSFDAWFTSWSFELAEGESVSVKVVTDRAEYVRSVTVPASVSFLEGKYNTLTVKMDAAVKTGIYPAAAELASSELTATFEVFGDCSWTAKCADADVQISPSSGSGNADVTVTVPENAELTDRLITVEVEFAGEDKAYVYTITHKAYSGVLADWNISALKTTAVETFKDASDQTDFPGTNGKYLNADTGSGKIEYYAAERTDYAKNKYSCTRAVGDNGDPYISGAIPEDYWLITVDRKIPAGTKLHYYFVTKLGSATSKYWMIEYKSGEEWKPTVAVSSVHESSTVGLTGNAVEYSADIEYNFAGTLLDTSNNGAYIAVDGTFTVDSDAEPLQIRFRQAGHLTLTSGKYIDQSQKGGQTRFSAQRPSQEDGTAVKTYDQHVTIETAE